MEIKHLIEAVLGILVGLALFPAVSDAATTAAVNQTGAVAAMLPIVPLIYVVVVLAGAAAYIYSKR